MDTGKMTPEELAASLADSVSGDIREKGGGRVELGNIPENFRKIDNAFRYADAQGDAYFRRFKKAFGRPR